MLTISKIDTQVWNRPIHTAAFLVAASFLVTSTCIAQNGKPAAANRNVIAIDVKSNDKGKTLAGTMTYSKEGPIGFNGKLRGDNGGDNLFVRNQWGGSDAPWHLADRWVIGARQQPVVGMKATSKDNGKSLNGTMTYVGEGPIGVKAVRTNGVVYDVDNSYAGSGWKDGGAWVLGTRGNKKQYLEGIDISSSDNGKTFTGKITYSGEGPINFRAAYAGKDLTKDGNTYKVSVRWGSSEWQTKGMWLIGGRNQRAVKVSAKSTDGGKTLSGTMTYAGEGPIGFKAKMSGGNAYRVRNQWGGPKANWTAGGLFVLGSR